MRRDQKNTEKKKLELQLKEYHTRQNSIKKMNNKVR